jgi:cytidyltransferase-like protein
MTTALFSGRFDRPHTGHIISIGRLGQKYDKVIVCVLDHKEQYWPVQERVDILKDALELLKGNYEIITNKYNFERITREQVEELGVDFDVYVTGNAVCYLNMFGLEYDVVDSGRYPVYAASDDRNFQKISKVVEEIYGRGKSND